MKLRKKKKAAAETPQELREPAPLKKSRDYILAMPFVAAAVFFFIEVFSRKSVALAWTFVVENPVVTVLNVLVILATMYFANIFRRRAAVFTLFTTLWIVAGIVNFIMKIYRVQPFTFVDIRLMIDGLTIMPVYFSWPQIILIFVAIFAAIAGLVMCFAKMPKRANVNRAKGLVLTLAVVCACVCINVLSVGAGIIPRHFENLVVAYKDYGFAYCFINTMGSLGISEPDDYSDERVDDILGEIDEGEGSETTAAVPEEKQGPPNIIYLQLESFIDVNEIFGSSYSQDPIPVFSYLMENYPWAHLSVPSVGGGTANTEFEVLTGMNLDFFSVGEYPYNTVLQDTPCETICYNLAEHGYASTAIHNYTATFYGRNEVYARLGFNRFDSLEYMPEPTYNTLGWSDDSILVGEIMTALRSTQEPDFVMTITVQTHGKYSEELPADNAVDVLTMPEGVYFNQMQNYVNQLYEVDMFISELLTQLESFNEPVIVVLYGDHLPALGLEEENLPSGDLYTTKYVIWNNYGGTFEATDVQAYQLSAMLLKQLGIDGGIISSFHQNAGDISREEYLNRLEVLEYDVLYGDMQAYGGECPYEPTQLSMGLTPITVETARHAYDRIVVRGKGFTPNSRVVLGDEWLDTIYVDANTLVGQKETIPDEGAMVHVAQEGINGGTLSLSNEVEADCTHWNR